MEIKRNRIVYVGGKWRCEKCGSTNVSIRCGMMADRAVCNNCGNEDYV